MKTVSSAIKFNNDYGSGWMGRASVPLYHTVCAQENPETHWEHDFFFYFCLKNSLKKKDLKKEEKCSNRPVKEVLIATSKCA